MLGQERGGLSQPTAGPTRDGRAAETRVLLSPGSRRRSTLPSLLLPQGWAPQPLRTAHLQCCAPSGQALPSLSSGSQVGGTSGPAPALSPEGTTGWAGHVLVQGHPTPRRGREKPRAPSPHSGGPGVSKSDQFHRF